MDLKMTNNETTQICQTEELWSEHLLSKFGLEYIKHDILINEWKYNKKEDNEISKAKALHKIAQVLHIEVNEEKIADMCVKFRQEIMLLLRQVVRQCFLIGWRMYVNWQTDFALMLLPSWLCTVEMVLMMLPQAVETERNARQKVEAALTAKFKAKLREEASAAFSRGLPIQANDFKKVSAYYSITRTEALDIWNSIYSKARQRILQEAQCRPGSREVDSELTDLLLLQDHTFSIVTLESLSQQKQMQKLTHLYQAVLKRDIENVLRNERPRLLEVWLQVLATYPLSLGFTSLVYIQRQWYELKLLARSQVLAYHLGRTPHTPHPLLLSIVANFRHIVEEPLPKWSEYVTSKMIVKLKDISKNLCNKVMKECMDELKTRKEAVIENNSTDICKHICVVQPMNNDIYINNNDKLPSVTQSNLMEQNIDEESKTEKSSNIINSTNKDENQTIHNEFGNTSSSVANNIDNLLTLNNAEGNKLDLNAVLNNIDPTKGKICLIFDSDSDTECTNSGIQEKNTNISEIDKKSCETKCDTEISQNTNASLHSVEENIGNINPVKEKLTKMDIDIEKYTKIDAKFKKVINIPIVRCDQTRAWIKYTNKSIDIHSLAKDLRKKHEENKIKTLPRDSRRCSISSVCSKSNLSLSLDGLSQDFIRNVKNKRLFRLCKPLSVHLQRDQDKTSCRRTKKVQLTDIEEVRKINSTILTAEVAPVSINRCDSPSEANSLSIFSEERMSEITNLNIIDPLELDDLFKKLPVPPLIHISSDKPMDTENIFSTHIVPEQNDIDLEQKTNNCTDQIYQDDINDRILKIIKSCPRSSVLFNSEAKLPLNVTAERDPSDSDDDAKLSIVLDNEKGNKRHNEETEQTQNKKKKRRKDKIKNKNDEKCELTKTGPGNSLEEWNRQKNLNKKYFKLPNIAPKPCENGGQSNTTAKAGNTIVLVTSNMNAKSCITTNENQPIVTNPDPVIDLTDSPDDTVQNSDITPIITNTYSLAKQTDEQNKDTPSNVSPVLTQFNENAVNKDLATITKVQVSNVGSQKLQNTVPKMNKLVPVSVAGQQIYVQQSQAQCTGEHAGRRFVIIPKSQLMNGNTPLLLPNLKVVNASLTYNPVDHIQKMMVPNVTPATTEIESPSHPLLLMPWMPLDLWVQGKSGKELVILQTDASKPAWTLNGGHTVVTLTDYACETPIYCSLPSHVKTRIIFPQENNGTKVYNPPTLQIYEDAANGTTPFAKWVKSVINKTENKYINECAYIQDDICTNDSENDKPVPRIKVKSFASLTKKTDDDFMAPSRVCLQDRLYMKVSEKPLIYAKVITALTSLEEFHNLLLGDAPLKLLAKEMTQFDILQSINCNVLMLPRPTTVKS